MLKRILIIQAILVSAVYSQTSTQSDFVFRNFPSKKELYVSLRQAAMGQQLAGITTDFYTDLFRNPAYLNTSDDTKFLTDFGSYDYAPYISVSYPMEYYYYSPDIILTKKNNSETEPNHLPNSLRIGVTGNLPLKLGKYGIFVHGFYQGSTRQVNDEYPLNPYPDYTNRGNYLNRNSLKYRYYDIHGFYAKTIAGWDAGIDYTYGREINTNRYVRNDIQESFTNNSSNYFNYRLYRYSTDQFAETDMTTHIFRLGAGKSFSEQWHADWTLTYEQSCSEKQQNVNNTSISYDSSRYSDLRTYSQNTSSIRHSLRPGNADVQNFLFSLNLRHKLSDNFSFVYLSGVDYVIFDADDTYSYLNDGVRLSRQDTFYYRSYDYQFVSTLSPSQKGARYGGNLGIGFELKNDRYLVAGALRVNGYTGQSDYDQINNSKYYNTLYQADTLFNDQRDSLSSLRPVDQKYYHYNIYLPLGFEYKITESFLVRLGVLAHWRYTESKAFKAQFTDKSFNSDINTYYSFGLGYHKNRVGVDFYGEGNLTSLNSWRMALTYKL